MTTVADAIVALIPDEQWVLRGDPTTEAEFNEMFRAIKGEDTDGTAIESDNPDNWRNVDHGLCKKAELDAAEPLKLLREGGTAVLQKQIGGLLRTFSRVLWRTGRLPPSTQGHHHSVQLTRHSSVADGWSKR